MNALKQIITKASLATVVIVIGLANSPVKAQTNQECTYGPNNTTVCTTSGRGSSRTVKKSSSSKTTVDSNVNVDISEKDVENLFRGLFGSGSNNFDRTNHDHRQNNLPKIPSFK